MSIVWLASFPKSGNTWMRVFLTNYLRDAETPVDINELDRMPIASARELFDRHCGIASSDLTHDEIDWYRPQVYERIAAANEAPYFMKVHDAYTHLPDGRPLFPDTATRGAVYIVRNPLDVTVSGMAHYNIESTEMAVRGLKMATAACDPKHSFANQLRQKLLGWSGHVSSWTEHSGIFPVHVVRYEDMLRKPHETFAGVVRFSGLPFDPARLEKSLHFSRFDVLQQQESAAGFRERCSRTTGFFRKGKIGNWQSRLSHDQARRIIADHREVLERLGYLSANDDGDPDHFTRSLSNASETTSRKWLRTPCGLPSGADATESRATEKRELVSDTFLNGEPEAAAA